ncbi:MAG: hypothetical protein UCL14_09435 [Collinsella sp.]|uniref:hypothetical protein n=1 Tax=Collinsella sp. TaxID=1965294 RepID=UPI002E7999C6|nr:hypothetical protein [Collinsella sp.]MEE0704683.1 hypothetical protein [Collinsella sp.]
MDRSKRVVRVRQANLELGTAHVVGKRLVARNPSAHALDIPFELDCTLFVGLPLMLPKSVPQLPFRLVRFPADVVSDIAFDKITQDGRFVSQYEHETSPTKSPRPFWLVGTSLIQQRA